jgi:hypothetical protein
MSHQNNVYRVQEPFLSNPPTKTCGQGQYGAQAVAILALNACTRSCDSITLL